MNEKLDYQSQILVLTPMMMMIAVREKFPYNKENEKKKSTRQEDLPHQEKSLQMQFCLFCGLPATGTTSIGILAARTKLNWKCSLISRLQFTFKKL